LSQIERNYSDAEWKEIRKYASNKKQRFTSKVDTELFILIYALHCQKKLVVRARVCICNI